MRHGIWNGLSTFNYNVFSGSNMVSEMVYQHLIIMYIVGAMRHGIRNGLSTFNHDVYSGSNMISKMVYQHLI